MWEPYRLAPHWRVKEGSKEWIQIAATKGQLIHRSHGSERFPSLVFRELCVARSAVSDVEMPDVGEQWVPDRLASLRGNLLAQLTRRGRRFRH